jgi:hypothetical protein
VNGTINFIKKLALCFFPVSCLLSCGLEAFLYIDYIEQPRWNSDTETTVQLPSSSAEGYSNYFSNFVIYYRIYTSDLRTGGEPLNIVGSQIRRQINAALDSDFNYLLTYTDTTSTTVNTSDLDNIFARRNYHKLELEGARIIDVLGRGSLNRELVVSFPPNASPTLRLRDANSGDVMGTYIPLRDSNLIQPLPDRYFLNDPNLYNANNATSLINDDVAVKNDPSVRYTYVSLYIAARGRDYLTTIYSQPALINIFMLAESN